MSASKPKPWHSVTVIANAHAVRHLATCIHCKGLLDARNAVPCGRPKPTGYWHGRCYIEAYGLAQFERLPPKVLATLTLGDIGARGMSAALAKVGA